MSEMPFSLTGKRILLVGAYSSIGRDFCAFATGSQARVTALGRRQDALAELKASSPSGTIETVAAEIETLDGFKQIVRQAAKDHGPFDGIFHCAGKESISSVRALSDKDFREVFSGSFLGASALAAAGASKKVLVDGGSLVLMSSVSSHKPQAGMAFYSASKAAIDALVRSAMSEYAARSARINSIVAGAVHSKMHDENMRIMPSAAQETYRKAHALGFGQPSDVSMAATYLLSDASKWVTGTSLVVDGGFLAG